MCVSVCGQVQLCEVRGFSLLELKLETVMSPLMWVLELNSGPVEEQYPFLTAEQTPCPIPKTSLSVHSCDRSCTVVVRDRQLLPLADYPTFQKHELFPITHPRSQAAIFLVPFLSASLSVHQYKEAVALNFQYHALVVC